MSRNRWAAGFAALSLAAGLGVATAMPAQAATTDPALTAATQYLVANLTGGTHYVFPGGPPVYTDDGLTVDGVFALLAAGGNSTAAKDMTNWLVSDLDNYADPTGAIAGGPYSGGLAKLSLLAEATGSDPHNVGGKDLLKVLTDKVCTSANPQYNQPPLYASDCSAVGDFYQEFSGISQALGVLALQGSPAAADHLSATSPVLTRLRQLQCPDGGFSSDLIAPGATCTSDVDTTGYAVQALATAPGTATELDKAASYLIAKQKPSGLFPGASGDNANSTALAAQALQVLTAVGSVPPTAQLAKARTALAGLAIVSGGFGISDTTAADVRSTTQVVPALAGVTLPQLVIASHLTVTSVTPTNVTTANGSALTVAVATVGTANGGVVTATENSTVLSSGIVSGGNAVVTLPKLSAGTHNIGLAFAGPTAEPSSVTYAVTVAKTTPTLKVTKKPATVHKNTRAKLTVTVKATGVDVNGAKLTAIGAASSKKLASGVVHSGKVVLTLPKFAKGKHVIALKYAGTPTTAAKTATIVIKVR